MFRLLTKTVENVFDLVGYVIKNLHLQMFIFFAAVGLIVNAITGALSTSKAFSVVFHVILALTIVFAVLMTVFSIKDYFQKSSTNVSQDGKTTVSEKSKKRQEQPNYYRVKQDSRYVMAEYRDRYELYLETAKGLQYVRTDFKAVEQKAE